MLKLFLSNPKLRYENNPTTLILKKNKSLLHVSLSYDDDDQHEKKEGLHEKTTISIDGSKP